MEQPEIIQAINDLGRKLNKMEEKLNERFDKMEDKLEKIHREAQDQSDQFTLLSLRIITLNILLSRETIN
jgi:septin family protein